MQISHRAAARRALEREQMIRTMRLIDYDEIRSTRQRAETPSMSSSPIGGLLWKADIEEQGKTGVLARG